jgi:ribose transport system permease protein
LALATLLGVVNGLGATVLRVPPIIMTLATATLLQGLLVILAGGSAVSVTNPAITWLGSARPLGLPAGVWLWAIVAALMIVVLHRSVAGPRILALGANVRAAVLSGVREGRQTVAVFAASGFFAGLAGVLLLGMNRQGYVGIGEPYVLTSIAAVVLGGTSILGGRGSYLGTIPGALLLVTASALITMVDASAGWRNVMFGGLILGLLLVSGREEARR